MFPSKTIFSTTPSKAAYLSSLSSRTTCLRLRPSSSSSSSSSLASPDASLPTRQSSPPCTRKFTTSRPTPFFTTLLRSASASASTTTTTTTAASPTPSLPASSISSSHPPPLLAWNEFFQLRKRRRYLTLSSSIVGSGLCFFGGVSFLSTLDLADIPGAATLGLDPFLLLGLETFGFAVVGWLVGPVVGEQLFRVLVLGKGAGEFQLVSFRGFVFAYFTVFLFYFFCLFFVFGN